MSLGINTKASSEAIAHAKSASVVKPVDRPIFITGLGRSGTTIIHTMLSAHPNVTWMSLFCAKFPTRPYLNRWLMQALDIPLINIFLKRRFVPLENYPFWDSYFRGFGTPCRDLFDFDVDVPTAKSLQRVFSQFVTAKRNRLLIKITGSPRISFLHAIFPDAKFIHVTRDGRAVANSRLRTPFWRGWQGWQGLNLTPEMPAHYREEWERHRYSFAALAGIEWKAHLDQMIELKRNWPHIDILEVKYEAFCASPVVQLREIAEYCGLAWNATVESQLGRQYVKSENTKWRSDLTAEQQAILQEVMAVQLVEQGYELARADMASKTSAS